MYDTLSHVSAYEILAASGALLELGFVWVVAGVSRALSEKYDEPGLFRKLGRGALVWLRYVFEEPRKVVTEDVAVASGALTSSIGLTGSLTGRKSPESDIERLGREIRELRAEVGRQKEAMEKRFAEAGERFSAVEKRLQDASEQLSKRANEIERHLREIHASSLRKEKGGALVFMLGALLTLTSVLI